MFLNSEQLLSFVALVQTGSVGKAAQVRHLTQPAISNQLKRLQDVIGVSLYRRQGRCVVLTAVGEVFYHHALKVQQSLQQAALFAEGLKGLTAGRVHVAASQTIAGSLLPAALLEFAKLYPDIEIFVNSSNSQQVFKQMQFYDLGLVESLLPDSVPKCCQVELLGHDKIVAVMRPEHSLSLNQTITLTDLTQHQLIWREAGSGTREVLERAWMDRIGKMPDIHLCLGGVASVLEAARLGLGVGVVSQYCLPTGESILTTRPFQPVLERPMSLLIPSKTSPLGSLVAKFLMAHLREKLMVDSTCTNG